jgi:hypothetical protein
MTFPTAAISTANLDSGSDNPANARADLLDLTQKVNTIISEANTAEGVLVLGADGKISTTQLPSNQVVTGIQILQPTDGIVQIRTVLRMFPIYTEDLIADFSPSQGDIAMTIDGDAGNPALACYDGSAWRIMRFRGTIGTAGADITATSTFSATADV